jgi:isopentenyl-diphosphate delta-isomerase
MLENHVILVDADDRQIGTMEKVQAHRDGLLHRAFSIFLFNSRGEMLLQKRAPGKYHTGGLWTNACCSHPRSNEPIEQALPRRLMEEMGIEARMKKAFNFTYRSELDNGLVEYELDHVYIGRFDGTPEPNPLEVCEWAFKSVEEIRKEINDTPDKYSPWFLLMFEKVVGCYKE